MGYCDVSRKISVAHRYSVLLYVYISGVVSRLKFASVLLAVMKDSVKRIIINVFKFLYSWHTS